RPPCPRAAPRTSTRWWPGSPPPNRPASRCRPSIVSWPPRPDGPARGDLGSVEEHDEVATGHQHRTGPPAFGGGGRHAGAPAPSSAGASGPHTGERAPRPIGGALRCPRRAPPTDEATNAMTNAIAAPPDIDGIGPSDSAACAHARP